jgi:glucan phosphoethanolaminetransferase (alkaline phosphatase superfamily)
MKPFDFRTKLNKLLSPNLWLWLFPLLLLAPNIALSVTEYNSVLAKITNIVLPAGFYMWICGLSVKFGRTVLCCLLFMILAAFQIVLLCLYGESIIAIDMYMNIVTTNAGEVQELLGNLLMAILLVIVFYLPPIVLSVYYIAKSVRPARENVMKIRRVGKRIMAAGAVFLLLSIVFVDGYQFRRELFPYNVLENLVTAAVRTNESMNYYQTSSDFTYHASMTRDKDDKEVYVFVIGETSRADNWSLLGYNRDTNPQLSKRHGLIAFSKVLSEINTTHKSVPMLLSYLTSETFGDKVACSKSIFAAFNEIGYQTAFISNQRRNHSYIDYYGEEATYSTFLTDNGGPQYDMNLVEPMKKIIDGSPSNKIFIVLHCYGSHFEYIKRYPSEMAHFTPDHNSLAAASNRDQLVNAYDNTVRYADAMLDRVIESLDSLNVKSAMIYVSDHGEDIFDDPRERFLHSSPTPTYYQIHVPMVVWMSDSLIAACPEKYAALKANRAKNISSSASVFHTLIDLSGIKTPFYDSSLSLSSGDFVEHKRHYLNDYNESLDLAKSGLRQYDFDKMKEMNISVE